MGGFLLNIFSNYFRQNIHSRIWRNLNYHTGMPNPVNLFVQEFVEQPSVFLGFRSVCTKSPLKICEDIRH